MASSLTTTAVLPPAVREYYDRMLLQTAFPYLIYTRFGQRRSLPKKSGDTLVFRRYAKLAPVPIPLVDGITPAGATLSATDIKARVSFYGNFVTITNQVQLTVEDRVINEASELLAQNLGQTMDQVARDCLASTSSVLACSNGAGATTPTSLSDQDIDAAVMILLGNDARMISKVVLGTDQFGTTPIRPAFMGYIDVDLLDDLQDLASFVNTTNYPGSQLATVMQAEWGSTNNVRWLFSSVGSVSAAATPVYNNFIVGQEAYGIVNLGSEMGEFYVKPLGSAGSADPLNQRGSIGWSHPFTARILNDSFMINLLCCHS